jgi:hypothetical protein
MGNDEGSVVGETSASARIVCCEVDLMQHAGSSARGASAEATKHLAHSRQQTQALVHWVEAFHLPSLCRKAADRGVQVTNPEPGLLLLEGIDAPSWEKSIRSALKKVVCEDLGNMDASALLPTIPETDSNGRGMHHIELMEKKLSVKVVFDDETGHVFMVGDSKKLEKKCFDLRNLLSHYHWRLSGRDVSFSK